MRLTVAQNTTCTACADTFKKLVSKIKESGTRSEMYEVMRNAIIDYNIIILQISLPFHKCELDKLQFKTGITGINPDYHDDRCKCSPYYALKTTLDEIEPIDNMKLFKEIIMHMLHVACKITPNNYKWARITYNRIFDPQANNPTSTRKAININTIFRRHGFECIDFFKLITSKMPLILPRIEFDIKKICGVIRDAILTPDGIIPDFKMTNTCKPCSSFVASISASCTMYSLAPNAKEIEDTSGIIVILFKNNKITPDQLEMFKNLLAMENGPGSLLPIDLNAFKRDEAHTLNRTCFFSRVEKLAYLKINELHVTIENHFQ